MRTQITQLSILVVLLLVSGCSSTTPVPPTSTIAPTPVTLAEELLGTWSFGGAFVQFSEDGIYRKAWEVASLKNDPFIVGDFKFDENSSILTIRRTNAENCLSTPGIYKIKVTKDGIFMTLTLVDDPCELRAENTEKYSPYTRVQQ